MSESTPRAHSRLQHPESPPGPPHCPGLTFYSRSTEATFPVSRLPACPVALSLAAACASILDIPCPQIPVLVWLGCGLLPEFELLSLLSVHSWPSAAILGSPCWTQR